MNWMLAVVSVLVPPRPWMPSIISAVIVAATLAMYAQLLWWGNPKGLDPVVLGRILGTLDTAFGIVLAYWLGTSKSSHDKDRTIEAISGKREVWTPEQRQAKQGGVQ